MNRQIPTTILAYPVLLGSVLKKGNVSIKCVVVFQTSQSSRAVWSSDENQLKTPIIHSLDD